MEYAEPHRRIKDWTAEDRPREKLLQRGIDALTDAEILAILLGSGTTKLSAVDLGRHLLDAIGDLNRLARCSVAELTEVKGIGPAKAIGLVAAFELARRKQRLGAEVVRFTSSPAVAAFLQPRLADLPHEEFVVLYLNKRHQLLAEVTVSEGGVAGTIVDPKRVFKHALNHLASAIIVAHNHPSGNLEPSQADLDLTQRLHAGANLLDISLLDHFIITAQGHFSFAEQGLLPQR